MDDEQPTKRIKIDDSDDCPQVEQAVGIRYRANKGIPRFKAVLKNRCCDFVVREITQSHEIVRLTDNGLPEETKVTIDEGLDELRALVGDESLAQLVALAESESGDPVVLPLIESKESRKLVHYIIRNEFTDLISGVVTVNESSRIEVKKGQEKTRRRWPEGRPMYLEFVLAKENMTLNDALMVLARTAHLNVKMFTFAGTKDKRSVSAQKITVKQVEASRIADCNPRLRNMAVGNFKYVSERLALGTSRGNHFTITLRHVDVDSDIIDAQFTALKQHGCINYYGHQRFGSSELNSTHQIGLFIIKGDYESAVKLILGLRPYEKSEDMAARQLYVDTGDAAAALKIMPFHMRIERLLLETLVRVGPAAFLNALEKLPRTMTTLYVHGFQVQ